MFGTASILTFTATGSSSALCQSVFSVADASDADEFDAASSEVEADEEMAAEAADDEAEDTEDVVPAPETTDTDDEAESFIDLSALAPLLVPPQAPKAGTTSDTVNSVLRTFVKLFIFYPLSLVFTIPAHDIIKYI